MLVCYLDDSGTDPQSDIVTLAGYAGREDQWQEFETAVEPIFAKYGVEVFHAVDMEKSKGVFSNWTVLKKQSFLAQICRTLSRHVPLGMSMSALKSAYKNRATESGRKRTVTPYTFCANGILDWVMTDIRVGAIAHDGLAFVFESGNVHNRELELHFAGLRPLHAELDAALRPVCFVPKNHCRAIQMADMFAYYSRRHGDLMAKAPPQNRIEMAHSPGMMLNIITEAVPHRAFVAMDFGPDAPGSRFYAGDLE